MRSNNTLHRCGQAAPVFRPVVEARLHFDARTASPQTTVTLTPDVAAAFPTEEAVNEALRRLMQTPETA